MAPNSAATVRLSGLHSVPADVLGLHRGVCQRHWSYMESCYDVVSFSLTWDIAAAQNFGNANGSSVLRKLHRLSVS